MAFEACKNADVRPTLQTAFADPDSLKTDKVLMAAACTAGALYVDCHLLVARPGR